MRRLLPTALVLAAMLVRREAAAEVPLCVQVTAPERDLEGFRKLVLAEVAKHPSHRVVEEPCRSHLRVELLETVGARFLTAQIEQEVPVRFNLGDPAEVGPRVEEAIRLVLHNDPTYLAEDVAHLSATQRFAQSVLVRGHFMFRTELFEVASRDALGLTTLPGVAFGITRGSGNWQILARLHGAGAITQAHDTDASLRALVGAEVGVTYEFLDKTSWSPYLSAAGGAQFVDYAGRLHLDAESLAHVYDISPVLSSRVGVRFFRWHDFDLDLFVQGYLPLTRTRDIDGVLLSGGGIYTPSLQIGLGVGF